MRGIYRVKNPILAKIKSVIDTLLEPFPHKLLHVRRELNKEADALANKGVDEKTAMPITFKKLFSATK